MSVSVAQWFTFREMDSFWRVAMDESWWPQSLSHIAKDAPWDHADVMVAEIKSFDEWEALRTAARIHGCQSGVWKLC